MGCSTKTKGIALSLIHLMLGVLSIVFGFVSIKLEEADYNDGVYGMGIWLGVWMLLTCLCGLLTASKQPFNKCRVTCFIGFCCYSIVALLVCCIPLIVGPINHFSFESKADKEYYKEYGPPSMYHKPDSYFIERNRIGRIGCTVYGAILCVILLDILAAAASCYIWKQAMATLTTPRRRRHVFVGSINTGYNNSLSFISSQTGGFVIDSQYPKLPSYRDIYPDGSTAWEHPPPDNTTNPAPPPYTETSTSNELRILEISDIPNDSTDTPLENPPMLNTPLNDMEESTTTASEPCTSTATNDSMDTPLGDPPMLNTPFDDMEGSTRTASEPHTPHTSVDQPISSIPCDDTRQCSTSAISNNVTLSDTSRDDSPSSTIPGHDSSSSTRRCEPSIPNMDNQTDGEDTAL